MMKDVMEGLKILLKYCPNGACDAQHDVLYSDGPSPDKLTSDELAQLGHMFWRWDSELESWYKFL